LLWGCVDVLVEIVNETHPDLFDGVTYEPEHDEPRLFKQLRLVARVLENSQWWTLWELHEATSIPLQSISARIRDLRKDRWGARLVDRRRRAAPARGLFEYRLVPLEEQRMREDVELDT